MDFFNELSKAAANAAKGVGEAASQAGKTVVDAANATGATLGNAANAAGNVIEDAASKTGQALEGAAETVKSAIPDSTPSPISESQVQELLSVCYGKCLDGIPNISRPVDELADDYLSKHDSVEEAAKALINMQLIKNTTSGALSGLTGFIALPVTLASIPANITNVLYVQMRMVAALAHMGGYDLKSDQVQTMVYVCMTGSAASDILKDTGIRLAGKLAKGAVEKIPRSLCTKINQAVGFRLVTKFGQTGIVNLGKLVPVAGAVVGGAFDYSSTKVIANVAYNAFIEENDSDIVEIETDKQVEANFLDHNDSQPSDGSIQ